MTKRDPRAYFGEGIVAGTRRAHRYAESKEAPPSLVERRARTVPGNSCSPYLPPRPCARCGQPFAPTNKRRLLCSHCFRHPPDAA